VAVADAHPLAARRAIRVRDLHGQDAVTVRRDNEPAWADAAMAANAAAGGRLEAAQETDTKVALLGLVAAELGLAIVTESLAVLGRRGVAFRPLADVGIRLPLELLVPPQPTPAAAAFVDVARATA
jgi:LysR family transcriptional regulator, benzoate and cis,cis-muconate-responsive activator of ben and cat genes